MRIAIDIDSTLHHYWEQLAEVVRRRYGVELPYEMQKTWGIRQLENEQIAETIAETHSEEWISAAEPYPGAVEVVNGWARDGHFIHITSHRDVAAAAPTERWLDSIGLQYDELYCSYDKITRCRELGIDLLVDDSPVNLQSALSEGILGATILHPWNAEVCNSASITSADDWAGLGLLLEPILAG
ncbi:MAG: hypothetical protein F2813_03315 [Actinobacteria bacterium]|uniref:Unannotated protein n=1 Tax=freshwater metagenome TaxID=449393 RepID=A0A6J5ZMR5_9ZZZZ|nr:hypothetical protein [Actinomycetota bacterium]